MAFDQQKYKQQFDKEKYDKIILLLPKGHKDSLKAYAKANDLSLNQLILRAVERQYMFDFSKKSTSGDDYGVR